MRVSRRQFLLNALLAGSSLFISPFSLKAKPVKKTRWRPAYAVLHDKGILTERTEQVFSLFENCVLCPRQCGVNRLAGEKGFCRAPAVPVIYSGHPHLGEEISLVGESGSGTIFFSNCNLRCIFCQNWPIAHEGRGKKVREKDLAEMMIRLQNMGCHNINLVTPTHVMPNILRATKIALEKGLHIPLVYNTSGYEREEIIKLLDGIVDIYLPDMKYMDGDKAAKYSSGARNYPEAAQKAIIEMRRQVGRLLTDEKGIALRGLMIRHLVMPNRVADTEKFVRWVAENLSRDTYINIMPQYRVEYKAFDYPEIARGIKISEFLEAMDWALEKGLTNLDPKSLSTKRFYDHFRSD
jgi:putative pyruvate formate lyase activating enzyme